MYVFETRNSWLNLIIEQKRELLFKSEQKLSKNEQKLNINEQK